MDRTSSPTPRPFPSPAASARRSSLRQLAALANPPRADRKPKASVRSMLEPVMEGEGRMSRDTRSEDGPQGSGVSADGASQGRQPWRVDCAGRGQDKCHGTTAPRRRQVRLGYSRPVGSVVVTLQHGVCMLSGGSLDPAYTTAVSALPYQVQATANRRNAALLQAHLTQALRVPPTRGLERFVAVSEDCAGWGGRTAEPRHGHEARRIPSGTFAALGGARADAVDAPVARLAASSGIDGEEAAR